jgi:hypothetical protein
MSCVEPRPAALLCGLLLLEVAERLEVFEDFLLVAGHSAIEAGDQSWPWAVHVHPELLDAMVLGLYETNDPLELIEKGEL